MVADQVQTFQRADHHRHRQRFGVSLRAHVVTQEVDDVLFRCDESADAGHRFGEGVEQHVHAVDYAEMARGTASAFAHRAEAVRVVHQQAEVELLFHRDDLVELAQVALHAEDAFGDDQYASAVLFGQFRRTFELLAAGRHVVVRIDETLAGVQAQTVDDAGVRFGVIDHYVAAREQAIDDRYHASLRRPCMILQLPCCHP